MTPAHPDWLVGQDGNRIWPVDHYAIEGARTTDWLAKGVVKQHRTIGTTLNTLIGAGFAVRRVEEWSPTAEQVAALPALADELERPMMLLVAAQKRATAAAHTRRLQVITLERSPIAAEYPPRPRGDEGCRRAPLTRPCWPRRRRGCR